MKERKRETEFIMYKHTYYTEESGRIFWITACLSPLDDFFAEVLDVTDQPKDLTLWDEEARSYGRGTFGPPRSSPNASVLSAGSPRNCSTC
jgi:hypothetical protein